MRDSPRSAQVRTRNRFTLWFGVGLCLVAVLTGCGKPRAARQNPDALAQVGDRVISQDDFLKALALRTKGAPSRYATPAGKAELLEELIDREALYSRAGAAGFDQQPEIRDAVRDLIISRYREAELSRRAPAPPIQEEAIQRYYAAHPDQYATSAKVRAAMILIRRPAKASAEKQAELIAAARVVLDEAKAAATSEAFARVVLAHSEDQGTRYRGGDLGWVARGATPWGMEPAAVDALFALRTAGEFAPLVSTEGAIYILKLLESQAPAARPLEQVREAIRYRLAKQADEQRDKDFYAGLKAGLNVRVNRALLDATPVPGSESAPPAPPRAIAQLP